MLPQSPQSTDHILLIEPDVFYANPETMASNVYQRHTAETPQEVYEKALAEFHGFREMLASNGVRVTTLKGIKDCPDHIFPNWMSTHVTENGRGVIFYPMLNDNRRKERTPELVAFFKKQYDVYLDLTQHEKRDKCLEANGSLCLDRANKVAYAALSSRTHLELAEAWAQKTGYKLVPFHTTGEGGKPVYHTDLVMWIGTEVAAICAEVIEQEKRPEVLASLAEKREVIELTFAQINSFCGNALEVQNGQGEKMLVMSEAAFQALTQAQKEVFNRYFTRMLQCPIPTIEAHGGGSARCLMLELF